VSAKKCKGQKSELGSRVLGRGVYQIEKEESFGIKKERLEGAIKMKGKPTEKYWAEHI